MPVMPDEKFPFCQSHIDMVREMTEIHTKQDIVISNQDKIFNKLSEVQVTLATAKITAIKDAADVSTEIGAIRLKLKPSHWLIGGGTVTGIAEIVHWIHKLFENRP